MFLLASVSDIALSEKMFQTSGIYRVDAWPQINQLRMNGKNVIAPAETNEISRKNIIIPSAIDEIFHKNVLVHSAADDISCKNVIAPFETDAISCKNIINSECD